MMWVSCPSQWWVKKNNFDGGGWGELYSFVWNVFNFANPLPQYVITILQWWRFKVNPGFYPPTLSTEVYLSWNKKYIMYTAWGPRVLIEHRCPILVVLRRVPKSDTNSAVIIGTGEHSRKVMLKPIWHTWSRNASPLRLISCHALTGCDTSRHIQGNGKWKGMFHSLPLFKPHSSCCTYWAWRRSWYVSWSAQGMRRIIVLTVFCPKQLHVSKYNTLWWHARKAVKHPFFLFHAPSWEPGAGHQCPMSTCGPSALTLQLLPHVKSWSYRLIPVCLH